MRTANDVWPRASGPADSAPAGPPRRVALSAARMWDNVLALEVPCRASSLSVLTDETSSR
jgi:hypothetical protein